MNIYEEYAKTKQQVALLQGKLKELEPQILEEIRGLSAPMKTGFGTFTTVTRVSWRFSQEFSEAEDTLKKKMEPYIKEIEAIGKEIEEAKKADIEAGKAEKEESVSIRFIEAKEDK